jgi:hypothetical protein
VKGRFCRKARQTIQPKAGPAIAAKAKEWLMPRCRTQDSNSSATGKKLSRSGIVPATAPAITAMRPKRLPATA